MGATGSVQAYAKAASELIRARTRTGFATLVKAAAAHVRYGLGPAEFFLYDLPARPVRSWRDYRKLYPDFSRALKLLNGIEDGGRLYRDKVACSLRALDAGIAIAPVLALVGREAGAGPFAQPRAPADLAALLDAAATPSELFVKPAAGFGGAGLIAPERHGAAWRVEGEDLSATALAKRIFAEAGEKGTLIQPRLHSHAALGPVGGALGLSTTRINTALTESGPEVFVAAQKLLGSAALADNFSGGITGNMLANIDLSSTRLTDVYGRRPGDRLLITRLDRHPATGTAMTGFAIPGFDAAKRLALRLAKAFPESPLLACDIAVTDGGVCLIEVNFHWDSSLPQLMLKRGIADLMRELLPRLAVDPTRRRDAARLMGIGPV